MTKVHCTPDGLFPHNPEPSFEHLEDLCQATADGNVDVGFAQDADADRLAIIDEAGRYLGEEYTLALAAMHILSTNPGPVAANLSTSRMVDDVAGMFGSSVVRSKVGEANVAAAMQANGCVVGGEGNGGVIDPRTCYTRDCLTGMALVLEMLARKDKKLSDVAAEIPHTPLQRGSLRPPAAKWPRCSPPPGRRPATPALIPSTASGSTGPTGGCTCARRIPSPP